MKRFFIFIGLVVVFASVLANNSQSVIDLKIQSVISQYLKHYANKEHFSAIQLSYRYKKDTIHDFTAGYLTYSGGKSITKNSLFEWGSVTKVFTAGVVLQLQAQPNSPIRLDQTLKHWFPQQFTNKQWPQAWRHVTIKSLINMTSGIPDYISVNPAYFTKQRIQQNMTAMQLIDIAAQLARDKKLNMRGKYQYSNTNYILLGMIASSAATQMQGHTVSFKRLMQTYMKSHSDALSRSNYYPDLNKKLPYDMPHNYRLAALPQSIKAGEDVSHDNLSWLGSAGALTGNTHAMVHAITDITKLPSSLNPFLYQHSYVSMTPSHHTVYDRYQQCTSKHAKPCYGFGSVYINANKRGQAGPAYFYEGMHWGSRAIFYWLPDRDLVIAVAVNSATDTTNDHLYQIIVKLLSKTFSKQS